MKYGKYISIYIRVIHGPDVYFVDLIKFIFKSDFNIKRPSGLLSGSFKFFYFP